ncbi:MAG: YdeI/OmpD-associated family protein [Pseudomonadota bacterium]
MSYYPHSFEAPIVYHDVGSARYAYTVVFVPPQVAEDLPLDQHPRLRVKGEINDHPFASALTPVRGAWYILLSKAMLKAIEAEVGDTVDVRFACDDQDAVDVPEALATALAQDAAIAKAWDALTPGKQRGLAYLVASAKRAETQAKRVADVFAVLRGERDIRQAPGDARRRKRTTASNARRKP